jgi:hypothetical protein
MGLLADGLALAYRDMVTADIQSAALLKAQ